MNSTLTKRQRLLRRQRRVRSRVHGTAKQPRLAVARSLHSIACQLIDDQSGRTLAATSDRILKATGTKTERAQQVGTAIAQLAKTQGIQRVVFDRRGRLYHGRIKALAEAARAAGLVF